MNNENKAYRIIDVEKWDRKEHFEIFRGMLCPVTTNNFELEITGFLKAVKEKHLSFTLCMTYASSKCADETEAFRYRFLNGNVVLYDHLDTRFSYSSPDSKYFRTIEAPLKDTMEEYVACAESAIREQSTNFPTTEGFGFVQSAPVPWITFTSLSHTINGDDSDAVPLFSWGKYFSRDNRVLIPYSIRAHHCFIDGMDGMKYVNKLKDYLDGFNED